MKIGYLVQQFPVLSQTFVLAEVLDHRRAGLDVEVVSLRAPDAAGVRMIEDQPLLQGRVHVLNIPVQRRARAAGFIRSAAADALSGTWGLRTACGPTIGDISERLWRYHLARGWRKFANRFNIIHCHFGNLGARAAALKRVGLMSGKLVVTFHGADIAVGLDRDLRAEYRSLFEQADLCLPISRLWARRLQDLGCDLDRIRVQRMGVAVSELKIAAPRSPGLDTRICIAGRFVEKKAHLDAVRALALIRSRRPDLNARMDLIGDGPLLGEVMIAAKELGISEATVFHGSLAHGRTLDLIARSDVFVLPSVTASNGDKEGIPVALMEAMALGIPVVSTVHSGIPELVEQGRSGLLSAEHDIEALARNLEVLLTNPALAKTLGTGGREKVEQEFNLEKLGQDLRSLYSQLMKPHI